MATVTPDPIYLVNDPLYIDIDPLRLEIEWQEQPVRVHHWAEKKANADRDVDAAKAHLGVIRAELYKAVSAAPDAFGMKKATEASIDAAILVEKVYKTAQRKLMNAQHAARMAAAFVAALADRKKALEKLVDLFLAEYFSAPRESNFAKGAAEDKARRVPGVRPKNDDS